MGEQQDMSTGKREMAGLVSAEGSRVNTLEVGRMVSRTPLRYECRCSRCGTASTIAHNTIRSGVAKCANSSCERETAVRKLETESRARKGESSRSTSAIEAEVARARQREAALRMEVETAGYEMGRPLSEYRTQDPGPMTERERLSARQRREESQALIRAAEEELRKTQRELAKVQRDTLLNPKCFDYDIFVSPEVAGLTMKASEASKYNVQQFDVFMSAHPEFLPSPRNLELIGQYWERHGITIVSAEMLERLYSRMIAAGVPFEQLEPEPQPAPAKPRRKVSLRIGPPSGPPTHEGWDIETGEARTFSEFEVRKMSSETFRRTFRLSPESLALPNIGPGPSPHR